VAGKNSGRWRWFGVGLIVAIIGLVVVWLTVATVSRGQDDTESDAGCVDCPIATETAETGTSADGGEPPIDSPQPEPSDPSESSRNSCLQCHPDVERQSGTFDGLRFEHSVHVGARLPCTRCHTSFDAHGDFRLASRADCQSCHHAGAIECSNCHANETALDDVLALPTGDFEHGKHLTSGLACETCHGPAADARCETCHDAHHRAEADCSSCHRDGAQALHTVSVHTTPCTMCHGDRVSAVEAWSRSVCQSCHADRRGHFPNAECRDCHAVPAMDP